MKLQIDSNIKLYKAVMQPKYVEKYTKYKILEYFTIKSKLSRGKSSIKPNFEAITDFNAFYLQTRSYSNKVL